MTNYITKTIKNGVEANIPVTSVNWQYGDVVVAWAEYNAGKWIEISDYSYESWWQWLSPEWFHIPSKDEFSGLVNTLKSIRIQRSKDAKIYLHMPYNWNLKQTDWTPSNQWSVWYYWVSTYYSSSSWKAFCFLFSNGVGAWWERAALNTIYESYLIWVWMNIRCFSDEYIQPTSTWTTIYSLWNWWIFWNQTDWIISITSDWHTWYTIADKNLWATTVWNDWDTLSEANCGKYYQWWNNYWFPQDWLNITTSDTQVDATNYWPWNYYSSSTFIINQSDWWDSSKNPNLWKRQDININNAISNIWVTSINYQWGDVIINAWDMFVEWDWIEINNNEIWLDWTYPISLDYSAIKWPSPEWFHVPQDTEYRQLKNILNELWASYSDIITSLKLPKNWYRKNTDWTIGNQWTSTAYRSSTRKAYSEASLMYVGNSSVYVSTAWPAYWYPIRCFKDTSVVPTSSWTKLYWTSIEAGWIFRDSSNWLISISSDWNTWITIADKNLWATTVYNDWDTLTQANMWNMYQRWNNYWFPSTWTVSTSATLVDASAYWPWNYYSNSTFRKMTLWPITWDITWNYNLWWWDTWVQKQKWNIIVWDKQYKIFVSSSAPASWTDDNIITIVTD